MIKTVMRFRKHIAYWFLSFLLLSIFTGIGPLSSIFEGAFLVSVLNIAVMAFFFINIILSKIIGNLYLKAIYSGMIYTIPVAYVLKDLKELYDMMYYVVIVFMFFVVYVLSIFVMKRMDKINLIVEQ